MMNVFLIFLISQLVVVSNGFRNMNDKARIIQPLHALAQETIRPPRLILNPLPKVYIYDHCPFCVRVRLALGKKNIKYEPHFLANDDVITPTSLIGKKMVPIFQYKPKDILMGESLDIIKLIDGDAEFGPVNQIRPFSGRKDLAEWLDQFADTGRRLQRSRYVKTVLPEFALEDGKDAYRRNHPLASYEKDVWLTLTNAERKALYEKSYETEAQEYISIAEKQLEKLSNLIFSSNYCTEGGFSHDDIDLWSRLRSITLVKGLKIPEKVKDYLIHLSDEADIPLYFPIAV